MISIKVPEAFFMRIKEEKYYLTLNSRQLSQLIEYLTGARNSFLDKNIPTDDVDNAILSLLKLRKKRKAKLGL